MAEHLWRRIGRRLRSPVKYSYGDRSSAYSVRRVRLSGRLLDSIARSSTKRDPLRGHCEAGSLTGAVHLSNDNAGVLRPAQWGRKPRVEQKGKCWLDLSLQYGARSRNVGLSILFISEFEERGVRKITTGITGLWRPSVHSDVAFWSFDVGSSYHCEAEFAKRRIVHPPIGNVSWV